jgi:hypothetical protein
MTAKLNEVATANKYRSMRGALLFFDLQAPRLELICGFSAMGS